MTTRAMKQETRTLIRTLYFVDQVTIADIAEALGLSMHAVRRALVLSGGVRETGPYTQEDES